MSKLSLQFKKLSAANTIYSSLLFLIIPLQSCINTAPMTTPSEANATTKLTGDATSQGALFAVSDTIKESWLEIRSASAPSVPGAIRLNAKSCLDQKFVYGVTLFALGQGFDLTFEEEDGQLITALVEDAENKLSGFAIADDVSDAICQSTRDAATGIVVLEDQKLIPIQSAIANVVSKLVPDCVSLVYEQKKLSCQLDALLPQPALVKTEDFQKQMIRKWSRQPYILARRTGVVSTLAKVATNIANDEGFAKFCRVLQFSLPEELPIVMTSKRWQSALCSGQRDLRREAAYFGLVKGTQELAILRELYESSSRVGLFSVKIPSSGIPSKTLDHSRLPLRITIAPDDDVSKKLVNEAKKYLGRPENEEESRRLGSRTDTCWHPIFSEASAMLNVANGMKLTGKGFNFECGLVYGRKNGIPKDIAALSKYLMQSLSSETEFVMENGQSKLLRLPEGKYMYTVHVLPPNPLDSEESDEEAELRSTGELSWGKAKNHSIRQW